MPFVSSHFYSPDCALARTIYLPPLCHFYLILFTTKGFVMSGLSAPSRSPLEKMWASAAPYVSKPIAAGLALIPVNYGFEVKSAQQIGAPVPKLNWALVKRSISAAPLGGFAVGLQMAVQGGLERSLNRGSESSSYSAKLTSSAAVGALSAPGYIVLNGHFLHISLQDALRGSSFRQVAAITGRESLFVLSLSLSGPVARRMSEEFGDRPEIATSAAFLSGSVGSVAGHAFDTWLTCEQKGVPIRSLASGGPVKALATGVFAALYSNIEESLDPGTFE